MIYQNSKTMNQINEYKNYKVLGYNTDFNKCDCCGKENLKGTVSMLHIDSEVVCHFGTTCAASIEKYDSLEAATKAKKDIDCAVREFKKLQQFAWGVAWRILRSKYGNKAHEVAPKDEAEALLNDCEKWYTSPETRFKAYPIGLN